MLIKNEIPTEEPIISIGIVLPNDNQKTVDIFSTEKNKNYSISIDDNKISMNNILYDILQLENTVEDSYFIINPVTIGRGFHWGKKIKLKLPGNLEVKVSENSLFVINHIKLETYLMCVATSEMSSNCPPSFLASQTIAARSWIIAASEQKHFELGIDACNDDCCQRYQGIGNLTHGSKLATQSTRGKFLLHNDEICDTRYSKSCGGISEDNENVWDEEPKKYLRSIFDGKESLKPNFNNLDETKKWFNSQPNCYCNEKHVNSKDLKKYIGKVDKKGNYFRWEFDYSIEEFTELVNEKLGYLFDLISSIKPLRRGKSGRILELKLEGVKNENDHSVIIKSEYEIRRVLHPSFLYSSAFYIAENFDSKNCLTKIKLKGGGWGHGVGLCQIGGIGMALKNKSASEILSHYFPSSILKKLYD